MIRVFCIILFSLLINNELPNDVRWVRNSGEYKALCHQVYYQAKYKLNKKLAYNNFSLNISSNNNYAVVMDLDETVLDNSEYQVNLFNKNESFNIESWARWVRKEKAKLVPGAKDYIEFLRINNIQVIFISNRMDARLQETKNNLKNLGIFSEDDIYLLRKNRADKKNIRRNEIFTSTGRMKDFEKFAVIQYLGDAMGDFKVNNFNNFGIDQFIFPNPMYGKW